jgi:hypothetical protein
MGRSARKLDFEQYPATPTLEQLGISRSTLAIVGGGTRQNPTRPSISSDSEAERVPSLHLSPALSSLMHPNSGHLKVAVDSSGGGLPALGTPAYFQMTLPSSVEVGGAPRYPAGSLAVVDHSRSSLSPRRGSRLQLETTPTTPALAFRDFSSAIDKKEGGRLLQESPNVFNP